MDTVRTNLASHIARYRLVAVISAALLTNTLRGGTENQPSVDLGHQKASTEQKLVVLEFFSYRSIESKILRDSVLADPEVKQELAENFIFTSVEFEKNPELSRKYEVTQVPLIILTKHDGTEVDRIGRKIKPGQFAAFLRNSADGRPELAQLQSKASKKNATIDDHLALADSYARREQITDALREYVWCFEHARELDPKNYRRNATLIIRQLTALGSHRPAAKSALRNLRDQVGQKVSAQPSLEEYNLVFQCNQALQEPERNIAAYLAIPENNPLRGQLFASIFDQLVAAKKYHDAVITVDLEVFVNQAYPLLRSSTMIDMSSDGPYSSKNNIEAQLLPDARKRLITDRTAQAVEALLAAGYREKACRLVSRALEFDGSRLLRVRLLEAVQRSGVADADALLTSIKNYGQPPPTVDESVSLSK